MLVQIRQAPTSSRILFYWNTISCSILRKLDGFILKQQIVFSRVKKAFALEQILFYRKRKSFLQKKKIFSSSLEIVFSFYLRNQYKPHKFPRGSIFQRARKYFLFSSNSLIIKSIFSRDLLTTLFFFIFDVIVKLAFLLCDFFVF